jgi:2-oxo-4-hydroxy-4-carboxy-5-ureidoimidazoline decarboxylase
MAAPNSPNLAAFNALPDDQAEHALLTCCSSSRWAKGMSARRPFGTVDDLYEAADAELHSLTDDDLDDALAGHPRIGERRPGPDGSWSRQEQSGLDGAHAGTLEAIAQANVAYENRFGHVYLVCATGKTADELLALLQARLHNDPQTERAVVRDELAMINRIRLGRLIDQDVRA